MTVIFSNPVALKAGTTISQGVQLADTVDEILIEVLRWNGTNSCKLEAEFSFDNGVTWGWRVGGGSVVPADLDAIKARKPSFDGNLPLGFKCWRMCQCGEVYIAGDPSNGTTTNHSTYRGWTSAQIAALPSGWLPNLDPLAFHVPDDQPATGLPLRQVRAITTCSGNVNTTITVSTVP